MMRAPPPATNDPQRQHAAGVDRSYLSTRLAEIASSCRTFNHTQKRRPQRSKQSTWDFMLEIALPRRCAPARAQVGAPC